MTSTTLRLPEPCTLPRGYRWGDHIKSSTYWLVRIDDDAAIRVELRPDYEMDADEIDEAIADAMPAHIQRDQIVALADEAAQAGDENQVALCRHALRGDPDAWEQCRRAIRAAEAMA